MKKTIIIISIIVVILCLFKSEMLIIPNEAIRFRIIANSNSEEDQYIKRKVVTNLESELKEIDLAPQNIELTRMAIKNKIPTIKRNIENTLEKLNKEQSYKVEYGMNYFPEKEYKGIKYEEGEYESLVIKLGDGLGDNFWCVLFPPLCLLEGEDKELEEVEYTSFIKELINKYF